MATKKILITVDHDDYSELQQSMRPMGFTRISNLARWLVMKGIRNNSGNSGRQSYQLEIEQPHEIEAYVKAKRLGSVANFAGFAMEQYMTRYPLKKPQKSVEGENTQD
jgi:hypothetical protein